MNDKAIECSSEIDALVGEVAEAFAQRLRRGEKPVVDDYVCRYPEIAETIQQILPVIEIMGDEIQGQPTQLAAGTDLNRSMIGEYRIVREVGRGGMGVVYEAEQLSLGRRVALKVLPFASGLDAHLTKRFRVESLAAAQLDHPHIVDVYGVGCESNVHFFSMRLIEGAPLSEIIRQLHTTKFSESDGRNDCSIDAAQVLGEGQAFFREVARIGIECAEALDHAHTQGVLHRDIKPGNILLDQDAKSWIADFGLARIESSVTVTATGDLIGTIRYSSPEQVAARRDIVDHRTDIYSLGITLYELLTLQPAFDDLDRHQLLRKLADEDPLPPRKRNPDIPVELETIVLKAIAKNPSERYETAQELAKDLKRYVDGVPIKARRVSRPERAWRWCKRNRAITGLCSAVAAALIAGLCVSLSFAFSESAARQRETIAKENVQKQKVTAERSSRIAKDRLVQLMDASGIKLMERGDHSGALLWLASAIQESGKLDLAATTRFQGLLDECWTPVDVIEADFVTGDGGVAVTSANRVNERPIVYQDLAPVVSVPAKQETSVIDVASGKELAKLPVRRICALSPNDRWAVSNEEDHVTYRVWDLQTGEPVSPILQYGEDLPRDQGPVVNSEDESAVFGSVLSNVLFDSEGKYLVVSGTSTDVWRTDSWERVLSVPDSRHADIGRGGKLVTKTSGGIQVWDLVSAEPITEPFGEDVGIARISADGTRVVTEAEYGGTGIPSARVWDGRTGSLIAQTKVDGKIYDETGLNALTISPNGEFFATVAYPADVRIWSMTDARMVADGMHHDGAVNTVEF